MIVVVGSGTGAARHPRQRRPRRPSATLGERAYGRAYDGLLDGARRLTIVTQSGSLPVYVAVVFSVVVGAIGSRSPQGADDDWGDPVLADSGCRPRSPCWRWSCRLPWSLARRRFVSVLLLGGVGQGLTVLFLMYGAPDLALTQFMIETLMIVAFVLVLRHLPHRLLGTAHRGRLARCASGWPSRWASPCRWFALAAGSGDRPTDVTDAVEQLSLPEAGGRNVVNVTIVDFRGIDTMGEITVFGIAALGVANLVAGAETTHR